MHESSLFERQKNSNKHNLLDRASSMETILELGTEAVQVGLNWHFHNAEKSQAYRLHNESMSVAKSQHERDLQLVKQTYLMDVFLNLEQHFQQLNAGKALSAIN